METLAVSPAPPRARRDRSHRRNPDLAPRRRPRRLLLFPPFFANPPGRFLMTDKSDGPAKRPSITDQEALLFHSRGRPGKLEIVPTKPMATQRDLSLAYSPASRFRSRRSQPIPRRPTTTQCAATWSRSSPTAPPFSASAISARWRPSRSWRARRFCSSASPTSTRSISKSTPRTPKNSSTPCVSRALVRRHQSRGHQGAGVLHHRGTLARIDGHSRFPRRSAWHRDHHGRRPDQRHSTDRPRHQDDAARVQRRRRGGHRLSRSHQVDRLRAVERNPLRHQGRRLSRPQGRHEPMEVGARRRHARCARWRRRWSAPISSSAFPPRAR